MAAAVDRHTLLDLKDVDDAGEISAQSFVRGARHSVHAHATELAAELWAIILGFLPVSRTLLVDVPRVCKGWQQLCKNLHIKKLSFRWACADSVLCITDAVVQSIAARFGGISEFDADGPTHLCFEGIGTSVSLKELRVLHVPDAVQLTEEGLQDIVTLPNLEQLTLSWFHDVALTRGVFACLSDLRVLKLQSARGLDENVMHELANFSNLRILDMAGCHITDACLAHLAELVLEQLSIHSCKQITDSGARFFSGISTLVSLNISNTCIRDNGLKPLGRLPHLHTLKCDGCVFSGAGFETGFDALRTLVLDRCIHITQQGMANVSGLPVTDLSIREAASVVDRYSLCLVGTAGKVTRLAIARNILSPVSLRELHPLQQLQYLDISNAICATDDDQIALDASIAELIQSIPSLDINQIISQDKAGLTAASLVDNRPNATSVDLNGCTRMDQEGVRRLMSLADLTTLNMSECPGVLPSSVEAAGALLHLQSLVVRNTSFDDTSMNVISTLPDLKRLDIVQCFAVTDAGLAVLANSSSLLYLYMGASRFRRKIIVGIQYAITDRGLSKLKSMQQLRLLDVRCLPQITEVGLAQFSRTVSIRVNGCVQITPAVAMRYNTRTPPSDEP